MYVSVLCSELYSVPLRKKKKKRIKPNRCNTLETYTRPGVFNLCVAAPLPSPPIGGGGDSGNCLGNRVRRVKNNNT